jgi:hypothetical protein
MPNKKIQRTRVHLFGFGRGLARAADLGRSAEKKKEVDNRKTQINPPLYLASTMISCWRCRADMPAVGLIAPNVPETENEVCILSDITELPASVLAFVQNRFPSFKWKFSKTTRSEYYANTCPKCGVLSGDFYLHSEPGGPFFPESEADAACLTVEQIPIEGQIEVVAGLGMGGGDLILEHGKKRDAESAHAGDGIARR